VGRFVEDGCAFTDDGMVPRTGMPDVAVDWQRSLQARDSHGDILKGCGGGEW